MEAEQGRTAGTFPGTCSVLHHYLRGMNMTDEEKAEEYADKVLFDSKYPFIFNKEKVKAYIIKVYLE